LHASEFEVDLNGFRLLQRESVSNDAFGAPYKTFNDGSQIFKAYVVGGALMIIGSDKDKTIKSIQLTGTSSKALPFKGLLLGDPKEKVVRHLGSPSNISIVDDPQVSFYEYDGKNYDVEIDKNGNLYSIKIHATDELINKTEFSESIWLDLKSAILLKNTPKILELFRPDAEIYKNGKTFFINKRYIDFVLKPDENFMTSLIGDKESVARAITEFNPTLEMRIHEKVGFGVVYKFPKSKILKEIWMLPYNGKYRVYEISFR